MPQRPTPAEEQAQQAFPVQAHEPDRFIGHHLRQRVEDRAPYARAGPVEHRDELSGRALPYPPAVARTSEAQEHLGFLLVAEDRQRLLAFTKVDGEHLYAAVLVLGDQPVRRTRCSPSPFLGQQFAPLLTASLPAVSGPHHPFVVVGPASRLNE